MTDNITLPREVVELALEVVELSSGGEPIGTMEREAIAALRTALAAPKQEPEPGLTELARQMKPLDADMAAILHNNLDSLYIEDEPALAAEQPKPSEDVEALRRDAEWLKTDAEMMRWLIDNHTAWSWNPSRYNTDVIGGFAAFSTGYLGFDLKTAIRKAMQDSALQEDKR